MQGNLNFFFSLNKVKLLIRKFNFRLVIFSYFFFSAAAIFIQNKSNFREITSVKKQAKK